MTLKNALKEAVAKKIASSVELRTYKAQPWDPDHVFARMYDIQRMRGHRATLREDIRYLHLAYAFSRGRPYRQQEPKVCEGNEPSLGMIAHVAGVSVESVESWYKGETPLEQEASTEAAE